MNPSAILRALLPAFLPLVAFVAAEALFGEAVGLAVGVAMGLGELLIAGLRERRLDPFVAADTALLALAGGVSLALGDDLFFKLKPAVVELMLGGALGLLLVLPSGYLEGYFRRVLRGAAPVDGALPALRRSVGLGVVLVLVHAALTAWAALALSDSAWAFVSGGLFYVMFALLAAGEYLAARLRSRRLRRAAGGALPGGKLLPLVDGEGRVTGSAPAATCHAGPGLLHPAVRVHLFDREGRAWLQRRSESRETEAGKWDAAAGGHVLLGESLEEALGRVLREGIGVTGLALAAAGAKPALAFRYRSDDARESELAFVFAATYGGPFAPDGVEVMDGRFWTMEELAIARAAGLLAPALVRELALLARSRS